MHFQALALSFPFFSPVLDIPSLSKDYRMSFIPKIYIHFRPVYGFFSFAPYTYLRTSLFCEHHSPQLYILRPLSSFLWEPFWLSLVYLQLIYWVSLPIILPCRRSSLPSSTRYTFTPFGIPRLLPASLEDLILRYRYVGWVLILVAALVATAYVQDTSRLFITEVRL